MKKSILIICRNNLKNAPRFLTEVNALKNDYNIIAAGYNCSDNVNYKFISLASANKANKGKNLTFHRNYPFVLRKFISLFIKFFFYRYLNALKIESNQEYKMLSKFNFDLLIVHHITDLPLAIRLSKLKRTKLIFNAHEYYPLEFDDNQRWMETTHLTYMNIANTCFKEVDICFCVGKKIAEKYQNEFKLKSIVINNSKEHYNLIPSDLKSGETIKIIHHGAALRSRKIELMIEMMTYLKKGYSLDLILVPGDETYITELTQLIKKHANIRLVASVNTAEIPNYINKYDIGLFLLPPTNFNYKYALPNKFFEFIQARLAIAIAPSPEMEEIVNKYDLGVVADDFTPENLAKKIQMLDASKIMYYKNQAHLHAKDLSMESSEELIKKTVINLL
ncbi:MAG: hypothetical protein ABI315_06785 [Bacteroidia bacterium]